MKKIPQFFPGQMMDFQDLNRLAFSVWESQDALLKIWFSEGAIITGCLEELRVERIELDRLLIYSGAAILPSGKIVFISERMEVKIEENPMGCSVLLFCQNIGEDFFEDSEFEQIKGFKALSRKPLISLVPFCDRQQWIKMDAVELARFSLQEPIHLDMQVRLWAPLWMQEGAWVDRIPFYKNKLEQMHAFLNQLQDIFGVEEDPFLDTCFLYLQAELRSMPLQLQKIQYLLIRLFRALAGYLEKILNESLQPVSVEFRETCFVLLQEWAAMRFKEDGFVSSLSIQQQFEKILLWEERLLPLCTSEDKPFHFIQHLQHQLRKWEIKPLSFQERWVVFGFLFKKWHTFLVNIEKKFLLKGGRSYLRLVRSQYLNRNKEVVVERQGIFLESGSIQFSLPLPEKSGPFILVFPQELRVHDRIIFDIFIYEKKIRSVHIEPVTNIISMWVNIFCVVPMEFACKKTWDITLQSLEKNFSFFGVIAYVWEGNVL